MLFATFKYAMTCADIFEITRTWQPVPLCRCEHPCGIGNTLAWSLEQAVEDLREGDGGTESD